MAKIKLDLNNPSFQKEWFNLEKVEIMAFNRALKKVITFDWDELYSYSGFNWEQIRSKKTKQGFNLYSFRFSQKYRAIGYRDGDFLVLLNLCVDHDSAYI
jgi:hypothetical protein